MNSILELKGQFQQQSNQNGFGPANLPKGKSVKAAHLIELRDQLNRLLVYWEKDITINT